MSGSSLPPALLDELPEALRDELDDREFAAAAPWLTALLQELGTILDAHVVAYRPDRPAPGAGPELCSILSSAELDDDALSTLQAAEAGLSQPLVLVAYARPARLRTHARRPPPRRVLRSRFT